MTWTFIFMMLGLKIPIFALIYLVYWSIKQKPEEADAPGGDGGIKNPHPRRPLPRSPRRGPHGSPAPASPPRVRRVTVRARSLEH